MAEFCLKWNNHIPNTLTVLQNLMTAETFTDVTLACDGHTIKAHRVILAACSTFFHQMFLANPSTHPIVVLHGMTYTTVKAIVDFMYKGEVSVKSSELAEMLHMARTLDVKGLTAVCKEQLCIEENEAARAAAQQQQQERLRKLQEQHKKKVTARKSVVVEREDDEDMVMDEDENEAPLQDIESNFEEVINQPRKKSVTKEKKEKGGQRGPKRRSPLWNYFSKVNSIMAHCNLCGQKLSYKTSLSNLGAHLKKKHPSVSIKPILLYQQAEVTTKELQSEKKRSDTDEVTVALLHLQHENGSTFVNIPHVVHSVPDVVHTEEVEVVTTQSQMETTYGGTMPTIQQILSLSEE